MINKADKNAARKKRHLGTRKNIFGTAERPRMNVYRSAKHIYVQLIDDAAGTTLVSSSTLDAGVKGQLGEAAKKTAARIVGLDAGKKAMDKGIKSVVFDRGGYLYTGRVAQVADGAREAGLEF